MKFTVCLISIAISNVVLAAKLVSLPFTAVDRKSLSSAGVKKQGTLVNAPLENVDLAYLIDVDIGTPPQNFTLLLDTGSSSTWVPLVGCSFFCGFPVHNFIPFKSSTFASLDIEFSIRYGEGFAKGYYARDTMTVNGVAVPGVNFAVSNINDGELTADGADGILGIGPDRLSIYNNPGKKVVPTLVTSMYQNGIIDNDMFSIYFQPVLQANLREQKRINGEIVFGGIQEKHYTGNISYIPVTSNKDFADYWAVDIDAILVGRHLYRYNRTISALVDTGSTLVFLPSQIINRVFREVRGLRKDSSGQYLVPCRATNLPDITIVMNRHAFTIKPDHYLITSGSLSFSNTMCYTYLVESPDFVDAILGYGFLQQYVSIYDNANKRIGLATRTTIF